MNFIPIKPGFIEKFLQKIVRISQVISLHCLQKVKNAFCQYFWVFIAFTTSKIHCWVLALALLMLVHSRLNTDYTAGGEELERDRANV